MRKLPSYLSAPEIAWYYALRTLCVLVLVFLLIPVFVIVPLSFSDSSLLLYPIQKFSLRWYEVLFQSSEWRRAAKNSFIIAPAATLLDRHAPAALAMTPCEPPVQNGKHAQ